MKHTYIRLVFGLLSITLIFGTMYVIAQQMLRQSANDIPNQIVEQAKIDVRSGKDIQAIVGTQKNELIETFSETPFMIAYDSSYNILATSATVAGQNPDIPSSVLAAAEESQPQVSNNNVVTWEPANGTREAIVVTSTTDGGDQKTAYIVAGISLRQTENHINETGQVALVGWLLTCLSWFGYWLISNRKTSN